MLQVDTASKQCECAETIICTLGLEANEDHTRSNADCTIKFKGKHSSGKHRRGRKREVHPIRVLCKLLAERESRDGAAEENIHRGSEDPVYSTVTSQAAQA